MIEKERACILCGRRELMVTYICESCKAKVQGEILGRKKEVDKQAQQTLKKFGVTNNNNIL
jgi:hypothetical protein